VHSIRSGLCYIRASAPGPAGQEPSIPHAKYGEIGFAQDFRFALQAGAAAAAIVVHSGLLKTKQALVPPKPKEFDNTNSTSRRRALCGTRSIPVSTDKWSRLSVG